MMQSKVLSGKWDDSISWDFHLTQTMPDIDYCTAVSCIAYYNGKVVLTKVARGWE